MTAAGGGVPIPQEFLEMPRWWHEGAQWLAELPRLVDEQCRRWNLRVTGAPSHGSNALVVPVDRSGESLMLRLAPTRDEVAQQAAALRFWAGPSCGKPAWPGTVPATGPSSAPSTTGCGA